MCSLGCDLVGVRVVICTQYWSADRLFRVDASISPSSGLCNLVPVDILSFIDIALNGHIFRHLPFMGMLECCYSYITEIFQYT